MVDPQSMFRTAERLSVKFVIEMGLRYTLKFFGRFNFDSYLSNITSILHEAKADLYQFD
jgi:hypothetical protein